MRAQRIVPPRRRNLGSRPASLAGRPSRLASSRSLGHFSSSCSPRPSSCSARPTATASPGAAARAGSLGQGSAALSQTPPAGELQWRPCWPRPKRCRRAITVSGPGNGSSGSGVSRCSQRSSSISVLAHTGKLRSRQETGVADGQAGAACSVTLARWSGRWRRRRRSRASAPFILVASQLPQPLADPLGALLQLLDRVHEGQPLPALAAGPEAVAGRQAHPRALQQGGAERF